MRLCALFLSLFAAATHGATYYVDFEHGSDSNNGTSTTTPWKRVKGMENVAGTAAAASILAGDRVVFRRGITWTASFPWSITSSGTPASPIIYDSEAAWTTNNAEWPVFDFEDIQFGGFYTGAGVQVTTKSNLNFNNLEFKRFSGVTNDTTIGSSYGNTTIVLASATGTIRFTNCYIHDWDTQFAPVTSALDDGSGGVSFVSTDGNFGVYIFHGCQLHQTNKVRRTGFAFSSIGGTFVSNTVHGVGGGFNGGGLYLRNHIYNLTAHTDTIQHGDAIICQQAVSTIDGNFIHDIAVGVCIWVGGVAPEGTNYVINNIISNSTPSAISVSTDPAGGVEQGAFVLNNTVQSGSGLCLYVSPQNGPTTLNFLQAQNNLWITASQAIAIDGVGGSGTVDSKQISHNLTNTAATATTWGATAGNRFKTTVAGSPPIDAGTNVISYVTTDADGVTRPQNVFDIGAHEFVPPTGATLNIHGTLRVGTIIVVP